MASTNKTPQLGLNQWAAGDEVLRADFNADNAKIEAGIEATKTQKICVTGMFDGNGVSNRFINLGFRPSLVIALGQFSSGQNAIGIFMENRCFMAASQGVTALASTSLSLTDTGFYIGGSTYFNCPDRATHYVAFH